MLTSDQTLPGFSLKLSASAKAYIKLGACAGCSRPESFS